MTYINFRGSKEAVHEHGFYWARKSLTTKKAKTTSEVEAVLPVAFPNANERNIIETAVKNGWDKIGQLMEFGGLVSLNGLVLRDIKDGVKVENPGLLEEALKTKPLLRGTDSDFLDLHGIDLYQFDDPAIDNANVFLYLDAGLTGRIFYPKDVPFRTALSLDGQRYSICRDLGYAMQHIVKDQYVRLGLEGSFLSTRAVAHAKLRDIGTGHVADASWDNHVPYWSL